MASQNKAILHYFNGKGKAEILRLVMAATGVQWQDSFITKHEDLVELNKAGKIILGNIPLVEYEGKNLVHSDSISRFFGRRGNLMGSTEDEQIKNDILFEGTRDFRDIFGHYGFSGWEDVLEYAKNVSLPKFLPIFETILVDNGSNGHLVGKSLSLADLGLFEVIFTIEEYLGVAVLKSYPQIEFFLAKIKSIETISKYLKGSQKPPKINQEYVDMVRNVMK